MSVHILSGLDAANPLGFFAALGLLRVLDDDAEVRSLPRPRLGFLPNAAVVAQIESSLDLDAIYEVVLEDARRQGDNVLLQLAYDDDGLVRPPSKSSSRDLKPRPDVATNILREATSGRRRTADLAAGLFSELVQDNNGNTKPTALHFTAGQQQFLAMVEALRVGVVRADLEEALVGPWLGESTLPSLSWDSAAARAYALRARNPSSEKRGSVAAANWLAVHALEYFPVSVQRGELATSRVTGSWKDSAFTWPVWGALAGHEAVRSLLRVDPAALGTSELEARSIFAVFTSQITRSDQGGYGAFSPSGPRVPRRS